jgi:glycosyltransferase involved in cell wall biosynthesis
MAVCLFCAAPDLNLIDGSSIWAQTLCLALAETGELDVHFLAKSAPQRDELFGPLRAHPRVTIIDGTDPSLWQGERHRRLSPPQMAHAASALDREQAYDLFVIRGYDIAIDFLHHRNLLPRAWVYLTDIVQQAAEMPIEMRRNLEAIAANARRVLCQSEGFRRLWMGIAPQAESKFSLYTPVIPDLPAQAAPLAARPLRAVYAGKFKREWRTLEMAQAWSAVRAQAGDAELVMIGDKIHAEAGNPEYAPQMKAALEGTAGVRWLGALSREAVQGEIEQARVGLSWRENELDESIEYSTKILEYGRAGCAAVLNRNAIHEALLGPDYPLYANSEEEFVKAAAAGLSDLRRAQQAADRLRRVAEEHTFTRRVEQLRALLTQDWAAARAEHEAGAIAGEAPAAGGARVCVLVAGHDLKFFRPLQARLEATGRFKFIVDQWSGHVRHDEAQSRRQLEQADVIFCEWCLGNVVWYAANKRPGQRLVARLHAQERHLKYLGQAKLAAIDHIAFVAEHVRRDVLARLDYPPEKTSVIPNFVDEGGFPMLRKMGDCHLTLGLLGIVPSLKRPDRALDVLERLLEHDPRYRLRIKGPSPFDYAWLVDRPREVEYYREFYRRINSGKLRYGVIFDPPGANVADWFSLVGFILSPSDYESFHMAVAEGMLTGSRPIVWERDGVGELWPAESVVSSAEEAAEKIVAMGKVMSGEAAAAAKGAEGAREFICKAYNSEAIGQRWVETMVAGV